MIGAGLDYVKKRVVEEDEESRKALYGRLLYAIQDEKDPWAERTLGLSRHEFEPLSVLD